MRGQRRNVSKRRLNRELGSGVRGQGSPLPSPLPSTLPPPFSAGRCKRAAAEACNSFPKGQEPAMPFNTLTAINSMSLHELIAELLKNYREVR